jgi:poly(3-hydroxybutyrate) depolymerase
MDYKFKIAGLFFMLFNLCANSQVGINTMSPEGALDVVSADSGIILPRVAAVADVAEPVDGMMVYDMSQNCFRGFQNGIWSPCFGTTSPSNNGTNIAGTDTRTLTNPTTGNSRDYIVHVPESASGNQPVPVLFFLHGTNQTGNGFFTNPDQWTAKADAEGFIVVYPTALLHCHTDPVMGVRTVTKWANGDLGETDIDLGGLPLCTGQALADDMSFFDEMVSTIKNDYNVDENRIYLAGFSNGAQMALRLIAERSDVFAAAAVHAGNYSLFLSTAVANNPKPISLTLGANDTRIFENPGIGATVPIPVDDQLMTIPNFQPDIIQPILDFSGLDNTFTFQSINIGGSLTANYNYTASNAGFSNVFRFTLIEGLGHSYINELVDPAWNFLSSYTLN